MKINFTGAHGTGKTSLVNQMVPLLKEITGKEHKPISDGFRNLSKLFPKADLTTGQDLPQAWLLGHRMRTSFLDLNFVADRSVVDTFAYITSEDKFPPGLNYLIANVICATIGKLTALIYVPIMFELVDDGVRSMDIGYQKQIDTHIQSILRSLREDSRWSTKKRIYSITSSNPQDRKEELRSLIKNLITGKR